MIIIWYGFYVSKYLDSRYAQRLRFLAKYVGLAINTMVWRWFCYDSCENIQKSFIAWRVRNVNTCALINTLIYIPHFAD